MFIERNIPDSYGRDWKAYYLNRASKFLKQKEHHEEVSEWVKNKQMP